MQPSTFLRLAGAGILVAGLSACAQGYQTGLSADTQRAAGGALAGAAIAKAVDGDVATGALIGGLAGATCDDLGVCTRGY